MQSSPPQTDNPAILSPLLTALFPEGVAAAELRAPGDPALLLPGEAAHFGEKVAAKRVADFAAGRLCARRALAELDIQGFALRAGDDRQPQWPSSVVGSITHTAGFCGAVVVRRAQLESIGVDAEAVGRVRRELWKQIAVAAEIAWLQRLDETEQAKAAVLIFAAKEAFYKCQYPITREWLGFHDVALDAVEGSLEQGRFVIRTLKNAAISAREQQLIGRFRIDGKFMLAGVAARA